jgi:hypothetical protein
MVKKQYSVHVTEDTLETDGNNACCCSFDTILISSCFEHFYILRDKHNMYIVV